VRAVITGGLGFVGRNLAARLLARGTEVVIVDAFQAPPPEGARAVVADICDAAGLNELVERGDVVFHLAAIRAGQGERDFDLAVRVNLDGSLGVLEACRRAGGIRLVFASTLAVFGGEAMPATVNEATRPSPQTTYGATKAAVELLVNDYARKGFVDGRVGRLSTVIVRPDTQAYATSAFASAVIGETLAGRDYALPVSIDTHVAVIGVRTAAECFVRLGELATADLGDDRVVNLPSLSATAGELVEAARRAGASGRIEVRRDLAVEAVVRSWPRAARADRALALGLARDESIDEIVQAYAADARLPT
jgi:nucleoside-diphosphate-sugar epimerase